MSSQEKQKQISISISEDMCLYLKSVSVIYENSVSHVVSWILQDFVEAGGHRAVWFPPSSTPKKDTVPAQSETPKRPTRAELNAKSKERCAYVYSLREKGMPFKEISPKIGVSIDRVRQLYRVHERRVKRQEAIAVQARMREIIEK